MPAEELPLELIEHVFHRGCMASTQFCLTLCLVSSWARCIALPHLYSAVKLQTQSSLIAFHQTIVKGKGRISPTILPLHLHVRSLWIKPISNVVVDIFNACENLEYISLHEENLVWLIRPPLGPSVTALPAMADPTSLNRDLHLWVVRGRTHRFYPLDSISTSLSSPFLNKITHLVLDGSTGYNTLKNIKLCNRLTHLAVTYDGSPPQDLESLAVALRTAPRRDIISCVLILLVDVLTTTQRIETLSWVQGVNVPRRIRVLPLRSLGLRAEWEEQMRTGVNFWEKVEKNSRGEIFGMALTP
ncbi:hypothetical protein D9756_001044 [Leucocoprinus leucothites]|uniref:Uncharacterized protein n=1 Tax=Leucocoprinus leucothites TaxID=201217 RepID=A0A8H5LNV1_9AGAR|nr:hypothetical protein D9756_001044 [Leucoagaricus leucothites]